MMTRKHDNRNFESQIVPRTGKFLLFGCAVGGILCSWLAYNECDFFTMEVTDANHPFGPALFENVTLATVGLFRYEVLQEGTKQNDNAGIRSLATSLLDKDGVGGQCNEYENQFRTFEDINTFTAAQCFGLIAFIIGCCALLSALAEASMCYHEFSRYPIVLLFAIATTSQGLTFLVFNGDDFCTHQDCEFGRGFFLSLGAVLLFFFSMIFELCMPRVDPFCRRKPVLIDENKTSSRRSRKTKHHSQNHDETDDENHDMEHLDIEDPQVELHDKHEESDEEIHQT